MGSRMGKVERDIVFRMYMASRYEVPLMTVGGELVVSVELNCGDVDTKRAESRHALARLVERGLVEYRNGRYVLTLAGFVTAGAPNEDGYIVGLMRENAYRRAIDDTLRDGGRASRMMPESYPYGAVAYAEWAHGQNVEREYRLQLLEHMLTRAEMGLDVETDTGFLLYAWRRYGAAALAA